MKAVKVSHQPGHARQRLFATSFGVSVLIHGLVIGWMLSGSGAARSLLSDVPSFHTVSLVDAPGSNLPPEPESQPQAIAKPAPAAKPKSVEEPEKPAAVETRVKKPAPAKASVKKPAPTQTSVRKPAPAAPKVAAAQPKAAPAAKATAKPRSPAGRNSPQAAARAQQAVANMRRAQARVQGTSTNQTHSSIAARMQNIQLQAYQGIVQARITKAWHLPMMKKTAQALQAVALLIIDREGQVIRYQLTTSSGNRPFDDALKRAVRASSPLPPLPEFFPGDILEAEIHFTPPASS